MNKKAKQTIISGIVISLILIFSLTSYFVLAANPEIQDSNQISLQRPINYGYSDGIMTDNTGLKYTKLDNGIMKVDDSFFTFAITGKVDGVKNIWTPLDFNWDWDMDKFGEDYIFSATSNVGWTQQFNFYPDEQMKITHTFINNYNDITEGKFWYIFTVNEDDYIEYGGEKYLVSDVLADGNKHLS
ncbi:unnamed protein product, partial [marine sediment metagenome]